MSIPQREQKRLHALQEFERGARARGFLKLAGVDEAGRGALAGPVVAAACHVPEGVWIAGVDDSKKLTPLQRARLHKNLTEHPQIIYGIGVVDVELIDQINILQATFKAMQIAVKNLSQKPDFLLIDGNQLPKLDIPKEGIVQGDSRSYLIACASILAKVTRDTLMVEYHERWPEYGFHENKGYGTEKHLMALEKHGPCDCHRKTYSPVAVNAISEIF